MNHRGTTGWPLALQLLLALSAAAVDDGCPMNLSEPAPEGARVVHGVLYAGRPERAYSRSQYHAAPDGGYRLCTCELKQCVRKCCEPGMAFGNGTKCTRFDELSEDFRVPKLVSGNGTAETHDSDKFHVHYGKPQCNRLLWSPHVNSEESFQVSEDGRLLSNSTSDVPRGLFCIEILPNSSFQYMAVVCLLKEQEQPVGGLHEFTLGALIISIPFLFTTFLVYALTDKLRDLHGKCLICHVLSLLMAYTSIIIVQLKTAEVHINVCVILGYSTQFFTLASFFWLNVMCIDLWCIFRYGKKLDNEKKQFKRYSLYAWGCSSLISIITYISDEWPNVMTFFPTPEIGVHSCGIHSDKAWTLYFYGPMGVILIVNAFIFTRIAVHILLCIRKRPESDRNLIGDKQKMILCLELFIVMGLNWTAEIISSRLSNPQTENVWFVTDLGNALQGVSIFVIFVCRERVLKLLNLQCCPRLRLFESSGPPPRQPKPVNNDASSNPTVTFKLYDIHFTDENEMINQQNPEDRHLLNGARPE